MIKPDCLKDKDNSIFTICRIEFKSEKSPRISNVSSAYRAD